jgi:hypothetical protein
MRFLQTVLRMFHKAGSILFVSKGGEVRSDNANLFWDFTNKRLGINRSDPPSPFALRKGTGAGGDVADGNAIVQLDSSGNATNFWFNGKTSASGGTNLTMGFAIAGVIKHGLIFDITNVRLGLGASGGGQTPDGVFVDANNNVVIGTAALATTATNGFEYIPTCAGTPTGVPTTYTGRVPMIYDTTNNKLYIYNGGWKTTTVFA